MHLRPANFYVFHDNAHYLQTRKPNTLTHLLIKKVSYIFYLFALSRCIDLIKPNGPGNKEYKEDEDEGDDDDDDDDDEYVGEEDEAAHSNPPNKKRPIEVVDEPAQDQGPKKIKA